MIKAMILAAAALTMGTAADAQTMIQKNDIKVENHLMTPEALWAMGRIGGAEASPNGKKCRTTFNFSSVALYVIISKFNQYRKCTIIVFYKAIITKLIAAFVCI